MKKAKRVRRHRSAGEVKNQRQKQLLAVLGILQSNQTKFALEIKAIQVCLRGRGTEASEASIRSWMKSLRNKGLSEWVGNTTLPCFRITPEGKMFLAEALKSAPEIAAPKGGGLETASPAPITPTPCATPENQRSNPLTPWPAAKMFELHAKTVYSFLEIVLAKRMRSEVRRELRILSANVDMLIESGREMAGAAPVAIASGETRQTPKPGEASAQAQKSGDWQSVLDMESAVLAAMALLHSMGKELGDMIEDSGGPISSPIAAGINNSSHHAAKELWRCFNWVTDEFRKERCEKITPENAGHPAKRSGGAQ